jgi:hypothetical protein
VEVSDVDLYGAFGDPTRVLEPDFNARRGAQGYDDAARLLYVDDLANRLSRRGGPGSPGLPQPGTDEAGDGLPSGVFTDGTVHRARVRGLKRPLVAAGTVFVLAMGGITAYEVASGHSLSGDHRGTTIGDVFTGGHPRSGYTPTTPMVTPSGQPSQESGGTQPEQHGDAGTQPPQERDQPSSPAPEPSGSQDHDAAGTGSGTTSGTRHDTAPDSGTGTDRPEQTPTPTPTATQGGDSGSGTDATTDGDPATRQPDTSSGGW